MKILDCGTNKLTTLDNLPNGLEELNCSHNKLTHLDYLPLSVNKLWLGGNPFKYDFEVYLDNLKKYILAKQEKQAKFTK